MVLYDTTIDEVPAVYSLSQNFPNPFNPTPAIKFSLRTKGHDSFMIYDVTGCLVRTLVDEASDAGHHEAVWDGTNNIGATVASGIYFCRF